MRHRQGLTLLELMLALALTSLILVAISMAIDLNLRVFTVRRTHVEEAQLARSTLRLIAVDLRAIVQHNEQDFSAVESMIKSALTAAASSALAGQTGGTQTGGTQSGGQTSGGQTGSGKTGGSPTGGSPTGGSPTGGSPTGSSPTGGGQSGGGQSSGGKTGSAQMASSQSAGSQSAGSQSSGSQSSGSQSASGTTATQEPNTQDLASSVTPPPIPGLYGNQYELMIDIGRLPRFDEFQATMDPNNSLNSAASVKIPSDVKTVVYYLGEGRDTTNLTGSSNSAGFTGKPGTAVGLVRRELDRSITQYASSNGNTDALLAKAEVIAPEVVGLEFRYFDGYEWFTEWDSSLNGGLPMAVEVLVALAPPEDLKKLQSTSAGLGAAANTVVYRQVIRLPTAKPQSVTDMMQSQSQSQSSATSTGSTSSM